MAKYIDREALIDYLTRPTGQMATCDGCCDIDCVECIRDEVIKNLPIADVVEVVRCKDCVFWDNGRCEGIQNGLIYDYTDPDDFCSYGGRSDTK